MKLLAKCLIDFKSIIFLGQRWMIIAPFMLLLCGSASGGPVTISGVVRYNGNPVPNYTFFWERLNPHPSYVYTGHPVTSDSSGNYQIVIENPSCEVNWPFNYYYVRFVSEASVLSEGGFVFYSAGCATVTYDVNVPPGYRWPGRYNAGGTPANQSVGCPVDVTNGNMWFRHTDYVLPGTVGGINVTRTYNSGINVSGIFGNGWASDYETKLLIMPSATNEFLIQLDFGTGLVVDFLNVGAAVYKSTRSGLEGQIVAAGTEYALTWKDGRTSRFSATGQLLWMKDQEGNQTSFAYDTNNNLTTITDPFGRSVSLTHTTNGRVSQISDSTGTAATYTYDTGGDYLTTVTYADSSQYKFEYVTVGTKTYLATVKDALNNILETHQYDSSGRATTSEKAGGAELFTIDYSHVNDTVPYSTVTDALGRVTKYYFDGSKGRNIITRLEGQCSCGGSGSETTEYEYDSKLNLTKITDALLNETTYTYDGNGNRLTQVDSLGTQAWTYNALGQVLTYKDRVDQSTANNTVVNTFDANGNLLTTTDALNKTTTLTYTSIGQPATITDARSKTTTLTYDTQGRLTQINDANNKNTTFGYDSRARITSTTNALSQITSFEYDLNNRLKKVTYPDTNFTTYTYDLAGRRTAVTDARNNTTNFAYDNAYRLTGVTDPLSHATTYGYDLMSNMTSQTDALGNVTNLEYDDFNRLKKVIYPPATVSATRLEESITYDKLGNVKTRVDTAGRTTAYDYDTSNRLTKITDALTNATQFEYNTRSHLTKVKDALNQEYIFTYDPLGRQLTQTRAGSTMSFEYDAVGNRTKRTDYNGTVTNYTYDNLNRLTQGSLGTYTYDDLSRMLTAVNSHGTVSFTYDNRGRVDTTTDVYGKVIDYDYDENGNRTLMKLDGSDYTNYAYDEVNRLTSQTGDDGKTVGYFYDNADRLIQRMLPHHTTLPNRVKTFYEYDGMSRLTRLTDKKQSTILLDKQYSYNTANQISQIVEPSRTRTFTYDNVDRLTAATDTVNGNESYAYDAVGNRTSSHLSSSYTYNPFNRLTATQNASYTYNANGAMTSRTDTGGTMNFVHDSDGRMVSSYTNILDQNEYRYDALGRRIFSKKPVATEYTYDGQNAIDVGGTNYQNGPGIDNKLSTKAGGGDSIFYLSDHLGTTTATTPVSGVLTPAPVLDSFGNGGGDFTGREYDSFSGLHYYRARMYDSNLGRFISEDPIGFGGGDVNLYGYVWNNPQGYVDPTGKAAFLPIAYAIAEFCGTGYDVYDFYSSLYDPNSDWVDVGIGGGGLAAGTIFPGAGYGKLGKGVRKYFGRRGSPTTRDQLDEVRDQFLDNNPDYRHVGGGRNRVTGEDIREEYLPNVNGGRKGGSYGDLSFEGPDGSRIRFNTYDSNMNGLPTTREANAADRLFGNGRGSPVVLIPKRKCIPCKE